MFVKITPFNLIGKKGILFFDGILLYRKIDFQECFYKTRILKKVNKKLKKNCGTVAVLAVMITFMVGGKTKLNIKVVH